MFLFKKLLSPLLLPLPLCIVLLLVGLLLLWFTRRQRAGKVLATAGLLLLLAQGYGWGFAPALKSLEREYAPLSVAPAGVKWVVVLGGGTSADVGLPLSARLTESSLARLVEGVRLYRQMPGATLLLSGGRVFGYGADADSMHGLAVSLGVNPADIVLDSASPDTEAQAQAVRQMVAGGKVVLVTSASHMPRAVGLFQKAGVAAIPAPTQYLAQDNGTFSPTDVFPEGKRFVEAERLAYEYLGSIWARLRGKI